MGDLKALSCPTCRWGISRYGIVRDKSAGMADNVTKETVGVGKGGRKCSREKNFTIS